MRKNKIKKHKFSNWSRNFGLNIALNLIEKGEKVLLMTETFESISYHYPIGAHTSKLKTDNLSLYSFNTKIINPYGF